MVIKVLSVETRIPAEVSESLMVNIHARMDEDSVNDLMQRGLGNFHDMNMVYIDPRNPEDLEVFIQTPKSHLDLNHARNKNSTWIELFESLYKEVQWFAPVWIKPLSMQIPDSLMEMYSDVLNKFKDNNTVDLEDDLPLYFLDILLEVQSEDCQALEIMEALDDLYMIENYFSVEDNHSYLLKLNLIEAMSLAYGSDMNFKGIMILQDALKEALEQLYAAGWIG